MNQNNRVLRYTGIFTKEKRLLLDISSKRKKQKNLLEPEKFTKISGTLIKMRMAYKRFIHTFKKLKFLH